MWVKKRGGKVLEVRSEEATELSAAIAEALEGFRARPQVDGLTLLRVDAEATEVTEAEQGRAASIDGWLARARAALQQPAEYRGAPAVVPDTLAQLAANPTAPAEQRIGSVLALREADPSLRDRVGVAVDEVADPVLAEAMEEALEADPDPKRLARALR